MTTAEIKYPILILLLLLFVQFGHSQSSYSSNTYLVKFIPGATQTQITQALSDLNSTELWSSPVTETRLWEVNSFPYTYAPNGNIITNINEQSDETKAKPDIEETGLNYESEIKVPGIVLTGSKDYQMDCNGSMSTYCRTLTRAVNVSIFDTGCSYPIGYGAPGYYFDIGSYTQYDYVEGDQNAQDNNNHGTHVTSVIAHISNKFNGLQNASLPEVHYDVRKTFGSNGYGSLSNIILAFEEAILDGMQIANMSFSFNAEPSIAYDHPFHTSLEAGLQYGVLIVCASGNDGANMETVDFPNYPASYDLDNILSVSTFDCAGDLAPFANFGKIAIDIAAPGIKIPGLGSSLVGGTNNQNGQNHIIYKTGTSQSTSIVTGIAAAMATHLATFDYALIKCAIINSAEKYQNLQLKLLSDGIVDADYALDWMLNNCQVPTSNGGGGAETTPQITRAKKESTYPMVYPNPSNGIINIKMDPSNIRQYVIIEIRDILGQIFYQDQLEIMADVQELKVQIDEINDGSYFLIMKNGLEEKVIPIAIVK